MSSREPTTDYLGAAIAILRREQRPLTDREITEAALRLGLLASAGKTPWASMSACLYVAVRDRPDFPIERIYEPGATRARRGSVRWRLRE